MKSINAAGLPDRRAWLEEADHDLAQRVEHRIASFDGGWHRSDPLYQRLRGAQTRVRRELSQAATVPDPRLDCLV